MKKVGDIVALAPEPLSREAVKRGYMARELVQCTLPHSDPKELEAFSRRDGHLTLGIRSGYDHSKHKRLGLPYGSIPRLLLLWMTSEAVRTQNPKLDLGNHLNEFLREVGLDPKTGGGKRGDAKRLKEQMTRLFRAEISFEYTTNAPEGAEAWLDMKIAPKGVLWWDFKQPDERLLFDSHIVLSEEFFAAITSNPVPIDVTIAGNLKRSPLAIDLFVWTTYRLYRMREGENVTISYPDLKRQFGANYSRMDNFKAALRDGLLMVEEEWPALKYRLDSRGLQLQGLPKSALPIKEKAGASRLLSQTLREGPYELSTADMLRAAEFAPGLDVREMRRQWAEWCRGQGITPEKPIAHFIDFLKKHTKRNRRS